MPGKMPRPSGRLARCRCAPADVRLHLRDVLAVEEDRALRRVQQPGDRPHRRRLAGAVRADQGDDLALLDGERDVRGCASMRP